MKNVYLGVLVFLCLSFNASFGDSIVGVSSAPRYYYNEIDYEPITVYEMKDSQGNISEMVMLRELIRFGYTLNWDPVSRQINIEHGTNGVDSNVPLIKEGTQLALSDIKTQFYGLEEIDTYVTNGLSFVRLEQLQYAYYDYLPDLWARPFLYALNLEGYFVNSQRSYKEKITAEQLSASIANILEGELSTFNRATYSSKGLSDFEGLKEAGIFSGVSLSAMSLVSREEMAQIGKNILDKLHVDYVNYDVESFSYSDSSMVSASTLKSVNLFYNSGVLSVNTKGEILPLNKVSVQEAAVILAKLLEKFEVISPYKPYKEERLALSDLIFTEGVYEISSFEKPLTISRVEPKLTLYNAFIEEHKGVLILELDQDNAPMGGIYSNLTLNPQITHVDVVLKTGEKIRKQMGRMPNYRYIGSGVFRTSLQLNPPVQGMGESSRIFNLAEIESIVIYAPQGISLRLKI